MSSMCRMVWWFANTFDRAGSNSSWEAGRGVTAKGQAVGVGHILICLAFAIMTGACAGEAESQATSAVLAADPVLGPDTNADGVRDDIGEYVDKTLPHDPLARQAAMQYARATRATLGCPAVRDAAVAAVAVEFRALECMQFVFAPGAETAVYMEIDARTSDTDARVAAYMERERLLGGMHYALARSGDEARTCDFDTSSLRRRP